MDYDRLTHANGGTQHVSFTLDGRALTLRRGAHYFASAAERVRALKPLPELAALGLGEGEDGGGGGAGRGK